MGSSRTTWFPGPRPRVWAALALLAACLTLLPSWASAARMARMTLEIQRSGEAGHTYYLVFHSQGPMAQYLLQSSDPPSDKVGGFLLTRDSGQNWYAINPVRGTCVSWSDQDVAAVIGGFVSKLKDWANLQIEAPIFAKLAEEDGEPIAGFPTRHYTYQVSFGFKASFLFSSWKYRISRDIDVWATQEIERGSLRDWLVEAPLHTGHPVVDRLIHEGLAEVKGVILKKRAREAVTDEDGKTTRSEITQLVTQLGEAPAPPVFATGWSPPPCHPQSREKLQEVIESLMKGK